MGLDGKDIAQQFVAGILLMGVGAAGALTWEHRKRLKAKGKHFGQYVSEEARKYRRRKRPLRGG